MKIRFDKVGYPLYCDAGPYEGDMRIDLNIRLYLSPEEYARYAGSESLQITLQETETDASGPAYAAEPSGELSAATWWPSAKSRWRSRGPPGGPRSAAA